AVQKIMLQNGRAHRSPNRAPDFVYLLSGILRCPTCDCLLEGGYGTSKVDDVRHFYYRHPSKARKPGCELGSIPAEQIEGIIVEKLKDLSLKEDLLQQIVERAGDSLRKDQPELQKLLDSRRKELKAIDNDVRKLLSVSDLDSVRDLIRPQLEELAARRKAIEKEVANLENGLAELKGSICSAIDLRNVLNSVKNLFDVLPRVKQKELLGYMLDAVNVSPKLLEVRFWNKSPMLDAARAGAPLDESRFEQWTEWLPGQDSNLQPCGYKRPFFSEGLGLSHHPGGCRALRPLRIREEGYGLSA
ncbi:MAG TPA: recombinase zinc beta ribbon domain-containing protein, partial [Planctomycetota bacterium]|nr:recombinase zinc beta ribbon domain-containing protein [Planctomycetota bacterium]